MRGLGLGALKLDNVAGSGGITVPSTVKATAEGDSLTLGFGVTGYPARAIPALVDGGFTYTLSNIATFGITVNTVANNFATRAGASYDGTKDINLYSIMCGSADGAVTQQARIYKDLRRNIKDARAAGYDKVVVGTYPSRAGTPAHAPLGDGYFDADTLEVNTWIRDYGTNDLGANAIMDFAANPAFATAAACSDLTYYDADKLHHTAAGEIVKAGIAADAYDLALGGTPFTAGPPTWSPPDTNQYLGLSNANRTIQWNTGGFFRSQSRSLIGKAAGKWYYEMLLNATVLEGCISVGLTNFDFWYVNTGIVSLHQTLNAVHAGYDKADGGIYINGVQLTTQPAFVDGDVLQFALDADAKLFWYRKVGQPWNGNGAADPATGVGGVDVSTLGTGPIYPAVEIYASSRGGQVTSRFAAAEMTETVPTGFTPLDG